MCRIAPALSVALMLAGAVSAPGQQATERYIPIGRSPGLAGDLVSRGPIERVDAEAGTLEVAGGHGVIRLSERTRIWIDRSAQGLTNLRGSLADLRPGLTVEIKTVAAEQHEADWIKIRGD